MELTYNEIADVLDVEFIAGSTIGYTLPPGIYEIADNNSILKSILRNKVKVYFIIDVNKLKTNLKLLKQ